MAGRLPVVRMDALLGVDDGEEGKGPKGEEELTFVLLGSTAGEFALAVDRVGGREEVVARVGSKESGRTFAGAMTTQEGQTVLFLDAEEVARLGGVGGWGLP